MLDSPETTTRPPQRLLLVRDVASVPPSPCPVCFLPLPAGVSDLLHLIVEQGLVFVPWGQRRLGNVFLESLLGRQNLGNCQCGEVIQTISPTEGFVDVVGLELNFESKKDLIR